MNLVDESMVVMIHSEDSKAMIQYASEKWGISNDKVVNDILSQIRELNMVDKFFEHTLGLMAAQFDEE